MAILMIISNSNAEMACDLNLLQLASHPTHQAGNTLDVILTNCDYCQDVDVHSNLPLGLSSDHYIIFFYIQFFAWHKDKVADSSTHTGMR